MGFVDFLKDRAEKGDLKAKNLLEQREKMLQLKNLDRHLRAEVLAAGVSVEEALELIIAAHFCSDPQKTDAFIALIFREGQLSFSDKLRMVGPLGKHCYSDLKDLFKCLQKEGDKIRVLRNKCAHCPLVLQPKEPQVAPGITVSYFDKGGKKIEEFLSKQHIEKELEIANTVSFLGFMLFQIVKARCGVAEMTEAECLNIAAESKTYIHELRSGETPASSSNQAPLKVAAVE